MNLSVKVAQNFAIAYIGGGCLLKIITHLE